MFENIITIVPYFLFYGMFTVLFFSIVYIGICYYDNVRARRLSKKQYVHPSQRKHGLDSPEFKFGPHSK